MIKRDILLTNIQRFSLHDGPGIRTTVFLKGCSIRCPWCSNPENLTHSVQKFLKESKVGVYGTWYSSEELYKEVVKDRAYYGFGKSNDIDGSLVDLELLPGGVTFSGGECMLQMRELEPLLKRLNEEQIHMVVETSLFASTECLAIALEHINLFYVDIKIMDEQRCYDVLGGRLALYRENLNKLINSGKHVVFRLPVIGGYTDGGENRRAAVELIKKFATHTNILKIELIKEHNLGLNKYQSILDGGNEIKIPDYRGVSKEQMESYKIEVERGLEEVASAIPVGICKI